MPMVNRIKQRRQRLEQSVSDVARAVGVSRQAISQIERGDIQPSAETMAKLARHFGVPMDDLFFLADDLVGARK